MKNLWWSCHGKPLQGHARGLLGQKRLWGLKTLFLHYGKYLETWGLSSTCFQFILSTALRLISHNLGCLKNLSRLICYLRLIKRKTRKKMKRRASWEREDRGKPSEAEGSRVICTVLWKGVVWGKQSSVPVPREHQWPKQLVYCPKLGWRTSQGKRSAWWWWGSSQRFGVMVQEIHKLGAKHRRGCRINIF